MKKLITLSLLFASFAMFGQVCEPNDVYSDTTGVFPPPYDAMVAPDGGINDTACIGHNFEFVFTVAVGESIELVPGFPQSLDSVIVESVDGLPAGLSLECNPTNCVYPSNFFGCAIIKGTPDASNTPGDYNLTIFTQVYSGGASSGIPITFPNPLIAPGEYILRLEADDNPACMVGGVDDVLRTQVSMTSIPNPSNGLTNVKINALYSNDFQFTVMDLMGNEVYREAVQIREGENTIQFDGTHLASGIYVYSLSNELGTISEKMIINK